MNIEDKSFPWENLNQVSESVQTAPLEKTPSVHWLRRWAPKLAGPALAVALIVMGRVYSSPSGDATQTSSTVVALVSPVVLAKGLSLDEIPFIPINLSFKNLTKADRLKIVNPDQLNGRKNRLVLKKLVPPNQPLLWSMIDFKKSEAPASITPPTKVIYGDTQ